MPTPSELRHGVTDLATLADADLDVVWRQVDTAELARDALIEALPGLIELYGLAAGALAADWYDNLRAEVGARGRYTARAVAPPLQAGTVELARWGTGPLFAAVPDWLAARTLVGGGLQRRIANVARDTITGSAVADPGADGWQRVARASGCGFCQMLAGRGAVYTEATADFGAHDWCHCTATVAWSGLVRPVRPYEPSSRNISDADRARVREWMAAHL